MTRRKRESELIGPNEDIFQKDAESTLITKEDFAAVLGIHEKDHELEELFQLYSDKVREYHSYMYTYRFCFHLIFSVCFNNRKQKI